MEAWETQTSRHLRAALPEALAQRIIWVTYDSCVYVVTMRVGPVTALQWHEIRIPSSMWGTDAAIAKICLEVP